MDALYRYYNKIYPVCTGYNAFRLYNFLCQDFLWHFGQVILRVRPTMEKIKETQCQWYNYSK